MPRLIVEIEITDPKLFKTFTSGFSNGSTVERMHCLIAGAVPFLPSINGLRIAGIREVPMPDEPVSCPNCGAGPGRQNPKYEGLREGIPCATGEFSCEVCRTEYRP